MSFAVQTWFRLGLIVVVCLASVSKAYAQNYNVLFVGDSISTKTAVEAPTYASYGGEHVADQRPDWTIATLAISNTANLLSKIAANPTIFSGRDVVYFNVGLHSIVDPHETDSPYESVATYTANLDSIVAQLNAVIDPDTRIIWRNTTPIRQDIYSSDGTASRGRHPTDVPIYNAAAETVMNAHGIQIDDVYSILLPYITTADFNYILSDGTHWSTMVQRDIITPHVIETIETPEPSSLLVAGIGALALFRLRR